MKRIVIPLLVVVALSLAAAPATETEALLREGNAAFRRGDYTAAADRYERAGLHTTEPALIAFDLAAAKYRQAVASADNRAKHLEEAKQYFSCCLRKEDPRRASALLYLGACLLQQALDGDADRAREAIDHLEECLRVPDLEEASTDDARHNLALARLLVAQAPPSAPNTSRSEDKPPDEGGPSTKPKPKERPRTVETGMNPNGDSTKGQTNSRRKPGDVKADMNRTGNDSQDTKAGGDRARHSPDGAAIDPADARSLKDAFDRILEEQQAYKRKKVLPPARGVKDW